MTIEYVDAKNWLWQQVKKNEKTIAAEKKQKASSESETSKERRKCERDIEIIRWTLDAITAYQNRQEEMYNMRRRNENKVYCITCAHRLNLGNIDFCHHPARCVMHDSSLKRTPEHPRIESVNLSNTCGLYKSLGVEEGE